MKIEIVDIWQLAGSTTTYRNKFLSYVAQIMQQNRSMMIRL